MDDGIGGDFVSLTGADEGSLATRYEISHGVRPGGLYRFRYRAINVNGASGWSAISYIRAAQVTGRPPAPVMLDVSAAMIELQLHKTEHDGGSEVTAYELWRNQGTGTVDFVKVSSYDGHESLTHMTHTLDKDTESLTLG